MWRTALFLIVFFLKGIDGHTQEIQNGLSYRDLPSAHYFRLNYENDFTFHTDYYYTQGVHFELVSPVFNNKLFRAIFPLGKRAECRYGIGLESAGYTPRSIVADTILYGDRPFAGMAYAKLFSIAVFAPLQIRITSTLSLGWMGPAAGGYEIQAYIHRHTGNPDPVGWKYQVGNTPILNYEVNAERALTKPRKPYLACVWAMARAGTLSTKAGIGATLMAGRFEDPFLRASQRKTWAAYTYVHPEIDFVAYDATLQGGPFTNDNPYTIAAGDISHTTFRLRAGAVITYHSYSVGASMRYLTKEFATGREHLTGGFDFVLPL